MPILKIYNCDFIVISKKLWEYESNRQKMIFRKLFMFISTVYWIIGTTSLFQWLFTLKIQTYTKSVSYNKSVKLKENGENGHFPFFSEENHRLLSTYWSKYRIKIYTILISHANSKKLIKNGENCNFSFFVKCRVTTFITPNHQNLDFWYKNIEYELKYVFRNMEFL